MRPVQLGSSCFRTRWTAVPIPVALRGSWRTTYPTSGRLGAPPSAGAHGRRARFQGYWLRNLQLKTGLSGDILSLNRRRFEKKFGNEDL